MKKLSIILACALVAMMSCTKSKEVHPELGDGNDEIVTVGMTDVHVEYFRNNMEKLEKVYFNYRLASSPNDPQHYTSAEMTKREDRFELTLTGLISDTLYSYYYLLMDDPGGPGAHTESKTFRTQACDTPQPPTPPVAELPTVVTAEVSEITTNSAQCGGEVTNNGGATVTERGICWGTTENPTLEDNHNAVGTGTGVFTVEIDGLQANTTYHVRAYATNEAGTAYGLDREFTTLSGGGSGAPEGAINGLFTINENGDQVYFSQGNLQYQASTNTWRFAEHQWDYVGNDTLGTVYEGGIKCNNLLVSSTYNGWIDLFGWGTSGWNCGNIYYQPWNSIVLPESDPFYGPYGINNLTGEYSNSDWGIYNIIYNGGSIAGQWRTLLCEEWTYIFSIRTTNSGIRFIKAHVNGINGVIVLPDNWNSSWYNLYGINQNNESFYANVISLSTWTNILQANGAVFLPAAGGRSGLVEDYGMYWSASSDDCGWGAYTLYYYDSALELDRAISRSEGLSVRLVQDANP